MKSREFSLEIYNQVKSNNPDTKAVYEALKLYGNTPKRASKDYFNCIPGILNVPPEYNIKITKLADKYQSHVSNEKLLQFSILSDIEGLEDLLKSVQLNENKKCEHRGWISPSLLFTKEYNSINKAKLQLNAEIYIGIISLDLKNMNEDKKEIETELIYLKQSGKWLKKFYNRVKKHNYEIKDLKILGSMTEDLNEMFKKNPIKVSINPK